jgi:hypothetical protein
MRPGNKDCSARRLMRPQAGEAIILAAEICIGPFEDDHELYHKQ